jgi:hypothetical protein
MLSSSGTPVRAAQPDINQAMATTLMMTFMVFLPDQGGKGSIPRQL